MSLKDARGLAGLTQKQLDELAGLRGGTVADIELGRNTRPAHEIVVRIIRALHRKGLGGITADLLFPVADDDQPDDASQDAPEAAACHDKAGHTLPHGVVLARTEAAPILVETMAELHGEPDGR